MAKRRRLEAPGAEELADLEAGFAAKPTPDRIGLNPPITQVAADAARASSPLDTDQRVTIARDSVDANAWRSAVEAGRVINDLPLETIDLTYLTRDRMVVEADALDELIASIRSNGLRLPIEVVALSPGRYGLVSGWRRMTALLALQAQQARQGQGPDFSTVKAIIRPPHDAGTLYTAMVEENELRAQLTPYERGRIAVIAAKDGVFIDTDAAIETIFATASRAKRSKIRSFAMVHQELGDMLHFPIDLSERNGLRLAYALREGYGDQLRDALIKSARSFASASSVSGGVAEGGAVGPAIEWALMEPVIALFEAKERKSDHKSDRGGRPKAQFAKTIATQHALAHGVTMEKVQHEDGYSIRLRGKAVDSEMISVLMGALEQVLAKG
jgi:ParB family chromosome partitioning protein